LTAAVVRDRDERDTLCICFHRPVVVVVAVIVVSFL
jgi:hypothetical protein